MKILIFFAITILFLHSTTYAKTFVIGVEELDYYPHYTIAEGKYQGYGRDILDAFAKKSGHLFKYVPKPVRRNLKELRNHKIDFYYPEIPCVVRRHRCPKASIHASKKRPPKWEAF